MVLEPEHQGVFPCHLCNPQDLQGQQAEAIYDILCPGGFQKKTPRRILQDLVPFHEFLELQIQTDQVIDPD